MTPSDRAPGASLPQSEIDRNALARRVFDAAISHPNLSLSEGLDAWLAMIEGVAGYLAITSATRGDAPVNDDELTAIGDTIQRAAQIARVLTDEVTKPARDAYAAEVRALYGIRGTL